MSDAEVARAGDVELSSVNCCRTDGACRVLSDPECDAWAAGEPASDPVEVAVGLDLVSIDLPLHARDRPGASLVYVVGCDDPQTDLVGRPIRNCRLHPLRGCQLHIDDVIEASWPVWPSDIPHYLRPFAQAPVADAIFAVTFREGVVFGEEEVDACRAR